VWPGLDDEVRRTVVEHSRTSDFPETEAAWLSLGPAGGFASARALFDVAPGLSQVYLFAT
jgi:hypothetical protein